MACLPQLTHCLGTGSCPNHSLFVCLFVCLFVFMTLPGCVSFWTNSNFSEMPAKKLHSRGACQANERRVGRVGRAFDATGPTMLTVQQGELVEILETHPTGWSLAKSLHIDRQPGWIPAWIAPKILMSDLKTVGLLGAGAFGAVLHPDSCTCFACGGDCCLFQSRDAMMA